MKHRVEESRAPSIRYRKADARDGVAMWRIKRLRRDDDVLSPFFYMGVMRRLAGACVVAENGGELVGYVIARSCDAGSSVRIVDLVIERGCDELAITAGMLSELCRLPAHARADFIEADPSAHHAVYDLLRLMRSIPVAKCSRRNSCTERSVSAGAAV